MHTKIAQKIEIYQVKPEEMAAHQNLLETRQNRPEDSVACEYLFCSEDFSKEIKEFNSLSKEEQEEYIDYISEGGYNMILKNTLTKIFMQLKSLDKNEFVRTVFSSLRGEEHFDEDPTFVFNDGSSTKRASYSLHNVFITNLKALKAKSIISDYDFETRPFECKILIARTPQNVLEFTKQFFSEEEYNYCRDYINEQLEYLNKGYITSELSHN
jgi:hypothetical protein